jgi:hypothetical protein
LEELESIKWSILGLSEVRRPGEEIIELPNGHLLYHNSGVAGQSGVGFVIHKSLKNSVSEFNTVSDRIAEMWIELNKTRVQIIQIYTPTSSHSDEEMDTFYNQLRSRLTNSWNHVTIVMGDFNGKVGTPFPPNNIVGKFGLGTTNRNGELLIEFASSNQLAITNTFFQKRPARKWTWMGPNNAVKNEIDYILCNRTYMFQDVEVVSQFNTGSDHRLLRGKITISGRQERKKLFKKPKQPVRQLQCDDHTFELLLKNRFELLTESEDINKVASNVAQTFFITANEHKVSPTKRKDKISHNTRKLLRQRRRQKRTKRNLLEYAQLCKSIRVNMKNDIRKFNTTMIKETIENNKSINRLFQTNANKKQILSLKKADGSVTRNRHEIVDRAKEFYDQLYKSNDVNLLAGSGSTCATTITPDEIRKALSTMPNGKAPGADSITSELLKKGGKTACKVLAHLFTLCINQKKIPEDWNCGDIILLHKKGDIEDLKNYRPITLMSVFYKLFTKVLCNRTEKCLDEHQPPDQAGFRKGYGTMDHLFAVNQLIQKCQEFQQPLSMAFIDYEKAFDSIKTSSMIRAISTQGVDESIVQTLNSIYQTATARIRLHETSDPFPIQKGVRQGDTISPKLFTATLEDAFGKINWDNLGISLNGHHLTNLRYADDVVEFAQNIPNLETAILRSDKCTKEVGLKMNIKKCVTMCNDFCTKHPVIIEGQEIPNVEKFIYLGQEINTKGDFSGEISRRIQLSWAAFNKFKGIFTSKIPLCLKRKLYNQCILPVMTYGCQTWVLTQAQLNRLQVTQRKMERIMLGITLMDKVNNSIIRAKTRLTDVAVFCKKIKWNFAGKIARHNNRWTKIFDWIPDGKRKRGRPRARWEDEIIKIAGPNWSIKAQDGQTWNTLGETFIQQWIDNTDPVFFRPTLTTVECD